MGSTVGPGGGRLYGPGIFGITPLKEPKAYRLGGAAAAALAAETAKAARVLK